MKLLLIAASLLSSSALAVPMEVITVIYRSPLDYALYQQNAEMIGQFNTELQSHIIDNAHHQLTQMQTHFNQSLLLSRQVGVQVRIDECQPMPSLVLLTQTTAKYPRLMH